MPANDDAQQLRVLPDPAEYVPEHCGTAAEFQGYKIPGGILKYVYECAGCGWTISVRRMFRHPITGELHGGLAEIIETMPPEIRAAAGLPPKPPRNSR